MKKDKIKYLGLVFVLAIAVLFLAQSSQALCLDTLSEPEANRTYPYSINIPLTFNLTTVGDCTSCKYNLYWNDSSFDYGNTSIDCDGDAQFDVDFDGTYFLTLYAMNTTPFEEIHGMEFHVDRSEFEDSKPYAAILGVLVLIVIAGFIFGVGKSFSDEHSPLKLFFTILPIIVMIAAVYLCILIAREYIKVPAIRESLEVFNTVYFWGVIFIFVAYLFVWMIVKSLSFFQAKEKAKKGGEVF